MVNEIQIDGNVFTLRTLTAKNMSPKYPEWLNDPIINRYLESRHRVHTLESCTEYLKTFDQKSSFLFGIFEKNSNLHIGNVTIYLHAQHSTTSFGYIIGEKEFWGTQAATEAIFLLIEYCFQQLKSAKVWGACYSPNLASVFNFIKFGFKKEGHFKKHFVEGGNRVDTLYYGLLVEDWPEIKAKKFPQLKGTLS